MKLMKVKGSTSQILEIFIQDSSSTTGAGLTGLTNASSGLVCYYHRNTAAAGVAVSLVTMTVGTFTSSGFKEVDSANLPGCYQLCLPDAAFATGADGVIASLKGATNMAPVLLEVQLTGIDHSNAASFGMTNLDATVSSRSSHTAANVRTEMDANSTKLDVATSTRASATDYTTARAAKIDNLDAAITTRATPAQILLTPANLIKTNSSNQVEASSVQGNVTGSVASVTGAVGSVTGNVSGNVTGSVGSVTAGVTVTTNNDKTGYTASTVSDKTGYSLSAGGVQAIWDALVSALTTAGSIGKRIVDNLDTNVGSRLATSGYTAPTTPPTVIEIRTEMDSNSTKLANLDDTISSRQPSGPVDILQSAADKVWSTTTRALTDKVGFALSSAGIQSIWDALTSALTTTGSIGKWIVDKLDVAVSSRNSVTPPTVAAIRSEIDSNSTKLDVAVSTRLAAVDYTAPGAAAPTVEEITDAVWSEAIPGSYTSSQAGGKLNALGNAADPLLNTVPGGYASGTAGYALGRLVAASISVTAPVLSSGNVQIVRGDSYFSADGRALVWTLTGQPTINLTGAITTFKAKNISSILTKTSGDTPGIRAVFSSGTLTLTLELAATDTAALNAAIYDFDIQTLFSNGHVDTWVMGKMVVVADVR
jgi:hypothetical protein